MLAAGLTLVLGAKWFNEGGRTPALDTYERFMPIALPGVAALRDIPIIGPIYSYIISGHTLLTYFAFLCVPITAYALARTRFGLRLRAVGENPHAVDTAGISVSWLRYRAVIICGLLCGLGGAYLADRAIGGLHQGHDRRQGLHCARQPSSLPIGAPSRRWARACCSAFSTPWQSACRALNCRASVKCPVQAVQALPYVLTVVLLAGFIGKAIPPRASGIPYTKDR